MTYILGNLYLSGPEQVLKNFARNIDPSTFELCKAEKASKDVWYIEFPTYRFSLLSLGAELISYVEKYHTAFAAGRPAEIELSVLSLRSQPTSESDHLGFYLEIELIQMLARLLISLDFDPDIVLRDGVPLWSARGGGHPRPRL